MASDIVKDAAQIKRNMKSAAQNITNLYEQLNLIYVQYTTLGITYAGNGTGAAANIPADAEAAAGVAALYTVYQAIDTNKQALFRISDIGNNIT